jgi:hypothetical protein
VLPPFHIHIPSIPRQSHSPRQPWAYTKIGSQAPKVVHHHSDHQCHNIDQIEHGFYAQDLDARYCNSLKMASWVGPMRGEIYKKLRPTCNCITSTAVWNLPLHAF